ncbi:MAG: hypothetical protein LRZ88_05870 [Candidatus Cloacimonetes bacterium]|nr:hypothetical protein [Candidatus Cloacimonadota bacterium]
MPTKPLSLLTRKLSQLKYCNGGRLPQSQGGAGGVEPTGEGVDMVQIITDYLGLTGENAKNENGEYEITSAKWHYC